MSADYTAKPDPPLAPGLYIVATPIGNLEDITLRALRVLRSVDRIACEDTRQTQKLLNHYDIHTPTVSYHQHNELSRSVELVGALLQGARIALVSDAGTPVIADPGVELARASLAANIPVFPIPGANAAMCALVGSGLQAERFIFHGFLPAKSGQRLSGLEALRGDSILHVFYEAPHRVIEALTDIALVFGGDCTVVLARELTKLHEEFLRGPVNVVRETLCQRSQIRGEFVILLPPMRAGMVITGSAPSVREEVESLKHRAGITDMEALKRVAKARGVGKSELYREWQREQKRR